MKVHQPLLITLRSALSLLEISLDDLLLSINILYTSIHVYRQDNGPVILIDYDVLLPDNLRTTPTADTPVELKALFRSYIFNLTYEPSCAVYTEVVNLLTSSRYGWSKDGWDQIQRGIVGMPKLLPPWAIGNYHNKGHPELGFLKESKQPNKDYFDDRDTLLLLLFLFARGDKGGGIAELFKDKASPFPVHDPSAGVPHPIWRYEHTSFIDYTCSLTSSSRGGKHLHATDHGPFCHMLLSQLSFLFDTRSYHNLFKDLPDKTEEEIELITLFTQYGKGEDDNYLFGTVLAVLKTLSRTDKTKCWHQCLSKAEYRDVYIPPWGAAKLTEREKECRIIKSLADLTERGLIENIDYFLDQKRLKAYVFEFGPCSRVTPIHCFLLLTCHFPHMCVHLCLFATACSNT